VIWLVFLVVAFATCWAHFRRARRAMGAGPLVRARPARPLLPAEVPLALFVLLFGDRAQLRRLHWIVAQRKDLAAQNAASRGTSAPPAPSRLLRPPSTGVVHLPAGSPPGLRTAWHQLGFEVARPTPGHVNGDACGHCSPAGDPPTRAPRPSPAGMRRVN
jgi:hypothetical protein